jgi:transposase
MKDSDSQKLNELQKRIEELESSLGRKQVHVEYLEKMIELAEKEYGIDIKKNSATPRSGGSGNTEE